MDVTGRSRQRTRGPSMASSDDSRSRRQSSSDGSDAPHPDDTRKPRPPRELRGPSWKFAIKRAFAEFSDDQCTDLAAALTYYAVLSLFPAAIALVSLLGVFGQGPSTINALLGILEDVGAGGVISSVRSPLQQLSQNQAAGFALVIGLLSALWSASGYVGAFGRAMNRIYEIGEGRPFWKLRPNMLLITLVAILLVALVLVALVVSGPLASAIGNAVGLSNSLVTVWNIAKWPVLVAIVVLII